MRKLTVQRIAFVVVAMALGSVLIATDAVAAGGNAFDGGWGGGGHLGGTVAGGRFSDGFGAGRFEHGHNGSRGLEFPFGYYGDYGAYSNNGCWSLDPYGCE